MNNKSSSSSSRRKLIGLKKKPKIRIRRLDSPRKFEKLHLGRPKPNPRRRSSLRHHYNILIKFPSQKKHHKNLLLRQMKIFLMINPSRRLLSLKRVAKSQLLSLWKRSPKIRNRFVSKHRLPSQTNQFKGRDNSRKLFTPRKIRKNPTQPPTTTTTNKQ